MNDLFKDACRKIPEEELKKHKGKWVAFSVDGTRIVESHRSLAGLERRLEAVGEDPANLVLSHLVEEEMPFGGLEL